MHLLSTVFNVVRLTQLSVQTYALYLPSAAIIVINLVVLYGNWQGMRRPQRGAIASLLGGFGMLAFALILWFSFRPAPLIVPEGILIANAPYVLLYWLIGGLQWRVAWLAHRAAAQEENTALNTAHLELHDHASASDDPQVASETLEDTSARR